MLLVWLLVPSAAVAQVENLCVTDVDPGPNAQCAGELCDQLHGTVAEALEAAVELPNEGGSRPEVWVCMGHELLDSGTAHVETVVVDNRGGTYGDPLSLILQRPLCPDPESGLSQPLIEVVTNRQVTVKGPVSDMGPSGPCGGSLRPGVSLWGGGEAAVLSMSINGWAGYGVANGLVGGPVDLLVGEGALVNGSGYAIRSAVEFSAWEMEIAGNRTDGAVALLWLDAPDQRLRLAESALYGNLVNGTSSEALVMGGPAIVQNTAFIANGTTDGQPLVETGPVHPDFEGSGLPAFGGLHNVVFARNRSLAFAPSGGNEVVPGTYVGGGESTCAAVPEEPYWERDAPFSDVPIGESGPLVRVTSQLAETIESDEIGLFLAARSLAAGNDPGPFIEADLPGRAVDVVLVHNTVADNGGAPVLKLSGQGQTTVTLVRNLYVDEPTTSVVELDSSPASVVSSMNASLESVQWIESAEGAPDVLLGPDLHFETPDFLDPGPIRSMSACERFAAVCPDVDEQDCPDFLGGYYICAPDIAAEYFPAEALSAQIGQAWPWETPWFGSAASPVAGATGWRCLDLFGTYDRFGHEGDEDGYPDVVDCDNRDADVIPQLPEHDGYSSIWCDAAAVDCYICPEGTSPPPDEEEPPVLSEGCSGCGFSWSCEEGAVLLLPCSVLLPMVRRKRARRDRR